jgi:hypothetical protein
MDERTWWLLNPIRSSASVRPHGAGSGDMYPMTEKLLEDDQANDMTMYPKGIWRMH